ncbi:MAG: PhnD/SsuA/transferrin family substrate-binding protein [Melioribacter sp.]|uniref:PhnD/SsuA/transferrin family substrate-binding protein n=1 Tax=Rosettibacter primus TaxID=3111523 RepID=UPI00247E8840|nr:PhnD/SsuA/transferrin family substrate-binding protein [Melioribacter sp.]
MKCYYNILALTLLVFGLISNITIAQNRQDTLYWGLYFPEVNRNYVEKIYKSWNAWMDLFKSKSTNKNVKGGKFIAVQYNSFEKLMTDIMNNKIDVLTLFTTDYFNYGLDKYFYPILTTSKSLENKLLRYVIICNTQKSGDLNSVDNIEFNLPESDNSNLMSIWVKSKIGNKKFSRWKNVKITKLSKTESQLIYSVFFNTINYAVVSDASLYVAMELNPQIKSKVKIIDISPDLINFLIVVRKEYDKGNTNTIIDVCSNLHKSVEGKQILNLAQAARFVPIVPLDLQETEKLVKQVK